VDARGHTDLVVAFEPAPRSDAAGSVRESARRSLCGAGAVLGVGLALSTLYATTGLGLACPLRMLTGWSCPLCGGTRMGAALLHLDLAAAVIYNPLALAALVAGALLTVGWVVQLVRGHVPRSLASAGARLAGVPSRVWWVVGGVVTIGYLLLRNLVWPIPA